MKNTFLCINTLTSTFNHIDKCKTGFCIHKTNICICKTDISTENAVLVLAFVLTNKEESLNINKSCTSGTDHNGKLALKTTRLLLINAEPVKTFT